LTPFGASQLAKTVTLETFFFIFGQADFISVRLTELAVHCERLLLTLYQQRFIFFNDDLPACLNLASFKS